MSMMKEFKEFAVKGSVLDMAVGIIIGVAFGKIVTSLVNDVITPPIGYVVGGVRFDSLTASLPPRGGSDPVTINYGLFLQAIFDFLIVAMVIFLVVKGINRMRRKEEVAPTAPPPPTRQELLLEEIRDLLRK